MYLYLIKRQGIEEVRLYEVLKGGREKHVGTMDSSEKSLQICGVYLLRRDAVSDLDAVSKSKNDKNNSSHVYINSTTAGRKIYKDSIIKYSISGSQYDTAFATVKDGKIISIASQRRTLELCEGAEVIRVAKINGGYYKVNEAPVYSKSNESADENE